MSASLFGIYAGSQASIMTKMSEDSKDEKKDGESEDGTITNDPNHPLLKVRRMDEMQKTD